MSKFKFNFDKYLTKFNELRFKIANCTEEELISDLLSGLPYEVIEKVKAKSPKSLMETISMARVDVNIISKNYPMQGNNFSPQNGSFNKSKKQKFQQKWK